MSVYNTTVVHLDSISVWSKKPKDMVDRGRERFGYERLHQFEVENQGDNGKGSP